MRPTRRLVLPVVATLVAVLAAACGGSASTASPSGATAPPPTPVGATPAPSDGATPSGKPSGAPADRLGYWLRMTTSQAIPPVDRFPVGPTALITAGGEYLVPGAIPMIYPGPLVTPLFARLVTDTGRAQIIEWAREGGLLSGPTDFTGDHALPGGVTGRIELPVDGSIVSLTGVPDLPGSERPQPGSPEAFSDFWQRVATLPETLPGELGAESPYTPVAYALLVGPPPVDPGGLPGKLMDWPLDVPIGSFGEPVADGLRCGLVDGDDAATLAPSLNEANQLTQWVQDPDTSATFGLTVRTIVPGEDPCAEVFGT
jgi:hypothetical protein